MMQAGMGMGMGQMMGNMMGQMNVSGQPAADDPAAKIAKLKGMLDQGLITQEEFNTKKAKILRLRRIRYMARPHHISGILSSAVA
jgi:membrane protease subunit (stomatin/prohibitin family)